MNRRPVRARALPKPAGKFQMSAAGPTPGDFFRFIEEYHGLIRRHIPGTFRGEYDSKLYMRPVFDHLERVVRGTPPGGRVLDLGCGRGHYSAWLGLRGLDCLGVEVRLPERSTDDIYFSQNPGSLKRYPALWRESGRLYGGSYRYFDGRRLDFADASFDTVLFYATYEHVPVAHIAGVTAEALRVLKPGGRVFIFRCPSAWSWAEHAVRALDKVSHEKLYGKGEILGLLRGAGFELESFGRSDLFPAHIPPVQERLNALVGPVLALEHVAMLTPLRLFAHHFAITARKPAKGLR